MRQTLKLWDLKNNTLVRTFPGMSEFILNSISLEILNSGDSICVYSLAVLSLTGELVSGEGDICVWSPSTGQIIKKIATRGFVASLIVLPSGKLVSGDSQEVVSVWNSFTGYLVRELTGQTDWIESLAFLPECQGLKIASGSNHKTIRIWQ